MLAMRLNNKTFSFHKSPNFMKTKNGDSITSINRTDRVAYITSKRGIIMKSILSLFKRATEEINRITNIEESKRSENENRLLRAHNIVRGYALGIMRRNNMKEWE